MIKVLIIAILMWEGSVVGEATVPDLVKEPHIMEVNVEEFREINKDIGITTNTRNIELNDEGEVVFVKDKVLNEAYTIVEGKGDITSDEYLRRREDVVEHKSDLETSSLVGAFGGLVLGVVLIYLYGVLVAKREKEELVEGVKKDGE